MGHGAVLKQGEFQRISAGTGINHSEFNPSDSEPTHFYQIWLHPHTKGLKTSYEQTQFNDAELRNTLRIVASPDGRKGSLTINQDAHIYLAKIGSGKTVDHSFDTNRHGWLQVLRGSLEVKEEVLEEGDGVAISKEASITLLATQDVEVILFELA